MIYGSTKVLSHKDGSKLSSDLELLNMILPISSYFSAVSGSTVIVVATTSPTAINVDTLLTTTAVVSVHTTSVPSTEQVQEQSGGEEEVTTRDNAKDRKTIRFSPVDSVATASTLKGTLVPLVPTHSTKPSKEGSTQLPLPTSGVSDEDI
jgi:hypothetical protein